MRKSLRVLNRKHIHLLTILLFSSILFLIGCEDKKTSNVKAETETKATSENKEDVISHKKYQKIFLRMVKSLKFKDYNFVEATEAANITAIEKDFSFGKRENLTLDGKQSHLETQERLVYEKKDKSAYLIVDLIYLNKPLENDMVYWNARNGEAFKENSPLRIYDDNLLVVNNLLIQTMILSTNGKGLLSEESYNVTKELIDYIEEQKLIR